MPRPVGHEGDQVGIGPGRPRPQAVETGADRLDHGQVGPLVEPADVVGASRRPPLEHDLQRARVVLHVQPVADLVALAVDRQRLARERLDDHQRDQLLREVVGAVVVGAVGHHHRQAVGVAPGRDQVVRRRLGRRIGRARVVGCLLGEQAFCAEGAVDLVGGDVVEAERRSAIGRQLAIVLQSRLKKNEGSHDIGLDELTGTINGTVHVALRGQMNDDVGVERRHGLSNSRQIADVGLNKPIAAGLTDWLEVAEGSSIGELVEYQDIVPGRGDQLPDQG